MELVYACLKWPIFVPNVGQFGPTLSNIATPKSKAVKMSLLKELVVLETTDKFDKTVKIFVPLSSFTHLVPKPE